MNLESRMWKELDENFKIIKIKFFMKNLKINFL